MSTSITLRVQAKGGKFLADDVGGAEVTIRDAQTGVFLGGGVAQGTDSGTLSTLYEAGASLSTIVTPGDPPTVYWLVPDADTSHLTLELPVVRPTAQQCIVPGQA